MHLDKPHHFIIQPHKDHYVVVNIKGKRENHTHIWSEKTCNILIGMVCRKTVPHSDYLKESARRISRDEKYHQKIFNKINKNANKEKFYKVNIGVWK